MKDETKTPLQKVGDDPSATSVSDVAKGGQAETETDRRDKWFHEWSDKAGANDEESVEDMTSGELEKAYSMIFGGMSLMMKSMSQKKHSSIDE